MRTGTCKSVPPQKAASPPPTPPSTLCLASQDSPSALTSPLRCHLCSPGSHSADGGFAELSRQGGGCLEATPLFVELRSQKRGYAAAPGVQVGALARATAWQGKSSSSPPQQRSTSAWMNAAGGAWSITSVAHRAPHGQHHQPRPHSPQPSTRSCTGPAARPVFTSNEASLDLCR